MFGLYDRFVLPHLVNCTCGSGPIQKQRQKVVPLAHGVVLEVGIGTGRNLPFYDVTKVERLIGVDPSAASWALAQDRAEQCGVDVDFRALSGEQLPLDDHSVDCAVVTYALCAIPNPTAALHEMRRVLRSDGVLLFCEHGRAPAGHVQRWQDRLNPAWKPFAGGCHLNRDVLQMLDDGGFDVVDHDAMYLPGTPKIAGYNVWGRARPTSA